MGIKEIPFYSKSKIVLKKNSFFSLLKDHKLERTIDFIVRDVGMYQTVTVTVKILISFFSRENI